MTVARELIEDLRDNPRAVFVLAGTALCGVGAAGGMIAHLGTKIDHLVLHACADAALGMMAGSLISLSLSFPMEWLYKSACYAKRKLFAPAP